MAQVMVPTWRLGDRLRRSLDHAEIGVADMAQYLGVGRNTVGNYLAGRTKPSVPVLRSWAARCEVPFEWLRFGAESPLADSGSVSGESWSACTTRLPEVQEQLPFGETIEIPAVAEPDRTVVPFRRAS